MAIITLKGNPIHTHGELPAIGSSAPDFVLVNSALENVFLANFGSKKKLLSVVPSLDTGVCQLSTRKFNEFAKAHPDVAVLTISGDLPFAQNRFCQSENLENVYTLSTMRSQDFGRNYGLLMTDGPLAGIATRAVLVLSENNQVLYAQLVGEIGTEPDYDAAFAIIEG